MKRADPGLTPLAVFLYTSRARLVVTFIVTELRTCGSAKKALLKLAQCQRREFRGEPAGIAGLKVASGFS